MTRPISGATCAVEEGRYSLTVRWWAPETAAFERVRASWRRDMLPHGARWDRHQRHWALPASAAGRLRSWVSATFLPEAVSWALSARPGSGARVGGASWGAHIGTEQITELAELAASYAALALAPGAPPALVEAARRVLAKTAHPDAGGSDEAMAAVNRAADKILADAGGK